MTEETGFGEALDDETIARLAAALDDPAERPAPLVMPQDEFEAVKATLAEIKAYCRDECEVVNEGLRLVAIVRASDILAIIDRKEGTEHG